MPAGLEIQLIAVLISISCALPGVFLVLRRMSLMSDSITHTILLGIVIAFFITHDLSSPLLILGAALMGVLTVWFTEMIQKTKLVSEDSAIGLVFPLLFSIAIILITRHAGSVHLDTDSVLLGELAFAPFSRCVVGGVDIGARGIYVAGTLLLINAAAVTIFFKELRIVTFDTILASVLGFSPTLIHYGLMSLVSLTAVGSFEAVGSVLVVAFMIGPPVTAYLLTDDLKWMLILSSVIGAGSAVCGYHLAVWFDISIAGMIAVVIGIIFLVVFIAAPKRGLMTVSLKRYRQKKEFAGYVFLMQIYHHAGTKTEYDETGITSLGRHLHWTEKKTMKAAAVLEKKGYIYRSDDRYQLTESGNEKCVRVMSTLWQ